MENKNNVRDLYWDVAKGIAILLVLTGHSIQCVNQNCFDDKVYQFIYSFHMPLFMFISGWFFYYSMRKYELVELVDKKIRSICIPLFVFGVILFPIFFDFNASIGTIIKNYILSIGILWFLVQVLYCMVAMTLVCRIFKGKWGGVKVCILICLSTLFLPNKFGMDRFSFMYPFFCMGYFFNEYKILDKFGEKFRHLSTLFFLISFLLLFSFYNKDTFVYTSKTCVWASEFGIPHQFLIDIYRLFVGALGTISFLLILKKIRLNNFIGQIFSKLGKMSMGIYCIQSIFWHYYPSDMCINFSDSIQILIAVLLSVIICTLFTYIITKIRILNVILFGGR